MMNSELNETPETQSPKPETRTEPPRTQPPPRKSLTPWVLVLPLALFASALWQSSRAPEKPLEALDMSATLGSGSHHKPATATEPPDNPALLSSSSERVLFVPDDNGDLKRVAVKDDYSGPTSDWPDFYGKMAAHLVNDFLFAKFPQHFPPGSEVVAPAKVQGDIVTLDFNQQFAKPEFWQGETKTLAAIYSIINTVVVFDTETKTRAATLNGEKSGAKVNSQYKVRFLIEGKAIPVLGEFETNEPVEPDMGMVARH
jgi:hypothetical protein